MLAALEAAIRANCKDESEWRHQRGKLYAPPRAPRARRRQGPVQGTGKPQAPVSRTSGVGLGLVDVEALIARAEADDVKYGRK